MTKKTTTTKTKKDKAVVEEVVEEPVETNQFGLSCPKCEKSLSERGTTTCDDVIIVVYCDDCPKVKAKTTLFHCALETVEEKVLMREAKKELARKLGEV